MPPPEFAHRSGTDTSIGKRRFEVRAVDAMGSSEPPRREGSYERAPILNLNTTGEESTDPVGPTALALKMCQPAFRLR